MKKRPYKLIAAIALLSVTVVLLLIGIITGVFAKEKGPTLTEPVFLGMEVRSTLLETVPNFSSSGVLLGDLSNKGEEIDQENPFPEHGTSIQQKIASTVLPQDSDIEFYTNQNQNIYVVIKLYNPDKLDILSVLFSGARYQKYQFEIGSDHENIILKINVGTKSGIVKYKVEDIKFSMDSAVKDAFLEGETTLTVGVYSSTQVTASVSNEIITTDKVSFSVSIADTLSLMQKTGGFARAVLFNGVDIVAAKDIAVGDSIVLFEGLDSNKKYQYAVFAYYDNMSGGGASVNILSKRAFYTHALVLFDAQKITVTNVGVNFDLIWNEAASNKDFSVEVFLGSEKKAVVAGKSISGLLSGVEYDIVVTFTDLRGEKDSIKMTICTAPKVQPTVEIDNIVPTKNSASFDLAITDSDSVGRVTAIEIVREEESRAIANLVDRVFTGLWSNTSYKIKVTYTYDLNDGEGERTLVEVKEFVTQTVPAPTVAIGGIVATKDSLSFDLDITDPDLLGTVTAIQLYKGDVLTKELTVLTDRVFENLDLFTAYKIKVVYTYDLNDGEGSRILEKVYNNAHTLTDTKVQKVSLKNSGAIKTGDTLQIEVELSDSNVIISKIKFNGADYTPTILSATKLQVNISVDSSYEGGVTEFKAETMYYTLLGTEYAIQIEANNIVDVFVNGKIEVKSLSLVDSQYNSIDYSPTNSTAYITLVNKTGYRVTSATINDVKYDTEKVTDNHYKISLIFAGGGWQDLVLSEIEYENEYISKKVLTTSNITQKVYIFEGEVVEITDDLQLSEISGNNHKAYRLMNDITLYSWQPVALDGVFDGNGYTINFVTGVVITKNDQDIYLGLFSTAKGFIKNLKIENAVFTGTLTGGGNIYAGILAGRESDRLEVFGVTIINGRIDVANSDGGIYVGGLIGIIDTQPSATVIRQCRVESHITLTASGQANFYAGGAVGYSRAKIADTIVTGGIELRADDTVVAYLGGIVGENQGQAENIFVAVEIAADAERSVTLRVGGLVGENIGSVKNSVTAGSIEVIGEPSLESGDVAGRNNTDAIKENNYSLLGGATEQTLNSPDFYTETLQWNQEIWNLSNLALAEGKYPTLRQ